MAYNLDGSMLEVCTCKAICPCWVGADPDNGVCEGTMAWHFQKGNVDGLDVSGLTLAVAAHIPGNVLEGKWKVVVFMDEKASPQQEEALLSVFTGKQGGPVADLAGLIGEVAGVERAAIVFQAEKNKGTLKIGTAIHAELEPFVGATGNPTTLQDTVFSSIPGSPAYVGTASKYVLNVAALGQNVDVQGFNSVQGQFHFES